MTLNNQGMVVEIIIATFSNDVFAVIDDYLKLPCNFKISSRFFHFLVDSFNVQDRAYAVIVFKVARLQEENRELKDKVKSLAESNGAGIPLDLSREFEQRVKRLEAELEVSEEQRRKAAQEVVKLQSQLSESQHAAVGNKEMLVSEVLNRQ